MATKKTLNAENLEALGASRLAQLLIEISEDDAAAKRRLRMELLGAGSPAELAKEIRKRLATIGRARSFVDWKNRKTLFDDLETQRRTIAEQVAKGSPSEGLELMWRFIDLAESVYARTDDGSGTLSGIFDNAIDNLGAIAQAARPNPTQIADQAFGALNRNGYGQFDRLIATLTPTLGPAGLEHLKQRVLAMAAEAAQLPPAENRTVIGWGSVRGPIYAEDMEQSTRIRRVRLALMEIADAQGDADGFIAQYGEDARKTPKIAADIATRLLKAGRAAEALQAVDAAQQPHNPWQDSAWEDARIAALEALGRPEDAQASRRSCFERSLSARHLRDYLTKLPDFDDFDAEQNALDYAAQTKNVLLALSFLISWPALDRAARLVTERTTELDGNVYELLTPAADALGSKYPLAATVVLRSTIDFTLAHARHSRYGHAARHLGACGDLAPLIPDYGTFETHDAYVARLRKDHGRKVGFWSHLKGT
jgi:hypothetical protein